MTPWKKETVNLKHIGQSKSRPKPASLQDILDIDYLLLDSSLLDGETIVIAFKKKALKKIKAKYPDLVIYFPPEIQELIDQNENGEGVKKVHLVKKIFKGWIVPSKSNKGRVEKWKR